MTEETKKQLKILSNLCKKEGITIFLIDNKLADKFRNFMNIIKKKKKNKWVSNNTGYLPINAKNNTTATTNPKIEPKGDTGKVVASET